MESSMGFFRGSSGVSEFCWSIPLVGFPCQDCSWRRADPRQGGQGDGLLVKGRHWRLADWFVDLLVFFCHFKLKIQLLGES